MSKNSYKYLVIFIGFALAAIGNACMGGLGLEENTKNSSKGSSSHDDSGVGGWSTYPGGSTNSGSESGSTEAQPGSKGYKPTPGTTSGVSGGASSHTASGGGGSGSGSCDEAIESTEAATGVKSPISCESEESSWEHLQKWLADAQAAGIPYCGIFKACKNCCGPDTRYDMFYGKCACPTAMDPATLGANSESKCEDSGMDYLAGFMEAKASVNIPCTTVKDCANCCGPANNLDKFHVECER